MRFNLELSTKALKNHEGGVAYPLTPEMELYTATVTSSLSPMTYEGVDERVERIAGLVRKCDPMFVARLAVYTRNVMNLRSIPLLLVTELANIHNGDDLVSRTVAKVVQRADEISELLACYAWRNPTEGVKRLGGLSKQIQKGLQAAFNNFDEYQFAKYNRSNAAVKLRDALFLVHPKAKDDEQQAIFDRIASDSLYTPYTWETELSVLGQKEFASEDERFVAFSDKWVELLKSKKLGYMALLRNLRNIAQYVLVANDLKFATDYIANPQAVANSRQFPFRFLAAYREIEDGFNTTRILDALEKAVMHSAQHIAGFDKNTRVVIASDTSGSMFVPISRNSSIKLYDVGLMLSMLLQSRCENVITGIFGDMWKVINLPRTNILANATKLERLMGTVGYGTNGHLVIEDLISRYVVADKVMMFTDMQLWNSYYGEANLSNTWHRYKKLVAPNAKLYLFDLAGYGQTPISMGEKDVYLIAGWSDKVFDILAAIENGKDAISAISEIEV